MDTKSALVPRVLIADDSLEMRELLCRHIRRGGNFRCELAADGEQAIESYHAARSSDPFKLLIVDAAMPLKSGFEVADYVRHECHDSVPIVIMTAHVETINDAHADFVKADAVLYKPFTLEQIKRVLALSLVPRSNGERVSNGIIKSITENGVKP